MVVTKEQVKELLQSTDIQQIRNALEDIALAESNYAESAGGQEQLLKLQIMLESRILSLQQSQKADAGELCATLRRVAHLWMRSGETERALGQINKALAFNAEDAETLQLQARAMLNLAKYDEAVTTQEKAIELLEKNSASADDMSSAYFLLASIFEAKGEFKQAIALLTKAADGAGIGDRVLAEVYAKAGCLHEKMGEYNVAMEELSKAHDLYVKTLGKDHSKTQEVAYLLDMASSS